MSPSGAWRRLLRLPASPPDPFRSGGAPRRGLLPAALLLLSFATVLAGGAAAQEVSFSSGTYRVSEGDVLTPELVLSHARSEDVTVRVEALDLGEAKSGEDFAADPWHVTVPAGQTRRSFDIATFHDAKVERNEQFLLHVAPSGHSPGVRRSSNGNPDAVVYINDDDTLVSLLESRYIVWEGHTATIRVTIANPRSTAFTLDYTLSGDTASGADVVDGFGTRSINVPANARGVDIRIRTAQDNVSDEGTETFSVLLSTSESGIVFGRKTADVWISDDDTTPTVTFESASSSADESAGTHYVTMKLSPAPFDLGGRVLVGERLIERGRLVILYARQESKTPALRDGSTATPGSDYVLPVIPGSPRESGWGRGLGRQWVVWVSQGETIVTVPVTIVDDSDPEGDETVVLQYRTFWAEFDHRGNQIYRQGSPHATHTLTIVDNDLSANPKVSVSFASASRSVAEGSGAHDVEVRLNKAPTSDLTVSYTVGGTATAGADFTITNSGTVTVPAGAKTATIPVTIVDDGVDDGGETVVLTLAAGTTHTVGARDTHTLYIDPVPSVAFPFPLGTIYESGGTYWVPVRLSRAPSSALALTYTVEGTALPGVDYKPLSGTVTAPAGATTVHIPVTIIDDVLEDNGETVRLKLADGSGYTVGSESGTFDLYIFNHESGSVEGRAQARLDAAVASGDGASAKLWRRALAAVRGEAPPDGLEPLTGAEAEALAIEHAGSGEVELASLWSEIARVIGDDATNPPPPEPAVTIAAGASPVTEGGDAAFTVTADPAPATDLPVTVTVAADGDYGIAAGERTVTVPTTGSVTLTLPTTGDDVDEPHGSVTVTVKDGDGYTVGASVSGSVTVQDDDEPAVTIAAGTSPVTEGGDAVFTLTADPAPAADLPVSVTVAADGDYGIAAGERTVTVPTTGSITLTLATTGDGADEPDGSVTVTVKDGDGYTVGSAASGSVTIQDDDAPPVEPAVTIAAGTSPVTEGTDATFTLTATPPPAADLPVSVTVATDGDWGISAGSRTVTVPTTGSATLTLATTGDDADEPHGSVTVTVTDGDGYTVGASASGSVTVRDDDAPVVSTPAVDPALVTQVRALAGQTQHGQTHVNRWRRVLVAFGVEAYPGLTPTTAAEAEANAQKYSSPLWPQIAEVLAKLEAVSEPDTPPVTVPAVSVTGGAAVTEGGDAVFTVTATPAPSADLPVTIAVATGGDYGISAGTQTVTVPTTGSATLTLATTDDATDEPDGSVTVTVQTGNGYTVGTPASGTVAVRDDDEPPPVVTIAAKAASVTEGGDAVFTLTADRAPAAALTVTLSVSETGAGDHVAASDEGPATLVIAKGATEAVFSVATVNDDADEPDSSAVVTVEPGEGYTVGAPASGTVTVTDDDTTSLPVLSVADVTAREGVDWLVAFTVRLSAPSAETVEVRVDTRPSDPVSAQPGPDYHPRPVGGHRLVFRAGETEKPVQVLVLDDSHDEEPETFEVVLSEAKGATIGDGVAVGTIVNDDPMPAAWLARFGRTVAEQALDGIAHRMAAPRTAGMWGVLAGRALDFDAPAGGAPGTWSGAGPGALALADIARGLSSHPGHGGIDDGFGHDAAGFGTSSSPHSQSLTARETLLGSSFTLTGERDASGGTAAFWGRASQGSFDGREGTFSLDGEATTALLGADYARDRWLIGLALAQSTGEGAYRDTDIAPRPLSQTCSDETGTRGRPCEGAERAGEGKAVRTGDGRVEASLTAALPYASVQASERLKLWGAAGYGSGEVTLETTMDGSYKADTTWRMAAAGLRGDLLGAPAEASGPALAVTSDALWTRTSSDRTRDLAASDSDATRLRLGLEGSWRFALDGAGHSGTGEAGLRAGGASLVPKLELGARHDGGDAETGFGLELGGGLAWSDPALGLTLDVSGRTLLAHEDDDLKDRGYAASLGFDPSPASARGPSLTLRQELGARADGGLDALFAPEPLEDRTGGEAASRWSMEAAYGLPAFGGRWTGSPHVGLGLATGARDHSVGWRFTPEAATAPDFSFGVKATRRESNTRAPEHTVGVEIRAAW